MKTPQYCPVCRYELDFVPWKDEIPAWEFCPCCVIQFGVGDMDVDPSDYGCEEWGREVRRRVHVEWR